MLLKLVETLKISWRTTAVDTSVANAISNVDTLHQLKISWRTTAVDTSVANAISNVDTLHQLKTAETAAVDVPVIYIIVNRNTDHVESA